MKKILICAGIILISITMIACQRNRGPVGPVSDIGVTVRLLTDATGVDDRSFNAAAWRGILEFYGDT